VTFPVTQVAVAQWSDDTLVHQAVFAGLTPTSVSANVTCGRVVDDADQTTYVEVCAYRGAFVGSGTTQVTYSRLAGTVTYFSAEYDAAWYEWPDGTTPIYTYAYNYRDGSSTPLVPLGSTYRFDVTLINGGVAYSKPVSFAITAEEISSDIDNPWHCQEFSDPTYGYKQICQEYINFARSRFGLVRWP
jgi:hypothetical protein